MSLLQHRLLYNTWFIFSLFVETENAIIFPHMWHWILTSSQIFPSLLLDMLHHFDFCISLAFFVQFCLKKGKKGKIWYEHDLKSLWLSKCTTVKRRGRNSHQLGKYCKIVSSSPRFEPLFSVWKADTLTINLHCMHILIYLVGY